MINTDKLKAVLAEGNADDISEVIQIVKHWMKNTQAAIACSFFPGDNVKWESRKRNGEVFTGVVTKVNRKSIQVKVGNTIWRVTPSLLEKI